MDSRMPGIEQEEGLRHVAPVLLGNQNSCPGLPGYDDRLMGILDVLNELVELLPCGCHIECLSITSYAFTYVNITTDRKSRQSFRAGDRAERSTRRRPVPGPVLLKDRSIITLDVNNATRYY